MKLCMKNYIILLTINKLYLFQKLFRKKTPTKTLLPLLKIFMAFLN